MDQPNHRKWTSRPCNHPSPARARGRQRPDQEHPTRRAPSTSGIRPRGQHSIHHLPHQRHCINPPFVQTRLTGGADYDIAAYNATSRTFTYQNIVPPGGNTCINGDCSLPGETNIVNTGCQGSISVFTVDYDAPLGKAQTDIRSRLTTVAPYNGTGSGNGSGPHWEPPGGWGPPGSWGPGGFPPRHHWSARWNLE